ncbi:MAG: deoxyribose-phosphate aldolase [Candidatus Melainabacteria bacterium RIFCSPHIGHO2_02_FULL_34_12]|nr:MAG: deoxyribose-phosphate aldolase [Candidatus Melainabacteria bacterium RIFCSPHIGHO2_02_FULL_34_12]
MADIQNLAKYLDHSVLKPESTAEDEIKKNAAEAVEFSYRALVIHPCNISLAKKLLEGSKVLTVSVCDFPHGKGLIKSRAKDVKEILKLGADEIDIVANYQYLFEQNTRDFKKDLKAIAKSMEGKILKIILEVDLLNERQIKNAVQTICKVANEENSKIIIKTKTGFTENKMQNIDAVKVIKKYLGELNQYGEDKIRIKASGGIRTKQDVINLIEAGAHIIGTSKSKEIIT